MHEPRRRPPQQNGRFIPALAFACLVVRTHLVRELHSLDGNIPAEISLVDHDPAVDVNVGQRVHEAEHALRRPCSTRKASLQSRNGRRVRRVFGGNGVLVRGGRQRGVRRKKYRVQGLVDGGWGVNFS